EFDGIRRFAKGGFATVYRAQCEKYGEVILKVLNNSENITNEFLQEIDNHRLFDSNTRIVKCYGISQDPKSKNYAIVMSYIDGDNLSQYLKKQKQWISFEDKIEQLKEIAGGVKDIHERRLIHRDLHPGNIIVKSNFVSNYFYKMYNDMQKHNAKKKRNAMHAYVSYMIYTTSLNHDDGKNYYPLFPDNDSKLAKLEYSSLDNESLLSCEKHKHEEEEKSVIVNWQKEVEEKNNTEFYQQYQTIKKEYDAFSQTTLYQIHPQAVTTSKLINTKIITQLLQQQKTEQSCSAMSKSISLDLNQIGEQQASNQEILQELKERIERQKSSEKEAKVISLKIQEEKLSAQLDDGREVIVPISLLIKNEIISAEIKTKQLEKYEL
ncbi:18273_t:CDS:2, partial [Racocetra persica]